MSESDPGSSTGAARPRSKNGNVSSFCWDTRTIEIEAYETRRLQHMPTEESKM
jgi:hypothetical protein